MVFIAKPFRILSIACFFCVNFIASMCIADPIADFESQDANTQLQRPNSVICLERSNIENEPNELKESLNIAVASNFYFPLSQLIQGSTRWSNAKLKLIKGSSGTLFAQISKGAPFDIYLSADTERPQALVEQGMATCVQDYVQGQLVLWPFDNNHTTFSDAIDAFLQNTNDKGKSKFAIANPKLAPYGQAAIRVLKNIQAEEKLRNRLVLGANVTQAFQFLDSGNAKLGLVSESVLVQAYRAFEKQSYKQYYVIPEVLYPAIIQQAAILRSSNKQNLANEFITFLVSEQSQKMLSTLGYKIMSTQSTQ